MRLFRSRPALRWLVPSAAAVVVIGGGAAAGTLVASAEPGLPERSAAQLLVDVQTADVAGFSGTVVQTADLGLPSLSGLGEGGADLTKLITGSNTARVWYAGEDKVRVAVLGALGETDVIRNGTDVWLWRSVGNTATRFTVPADAQRKLPPGTPSDLPSGLPSALPSTPQEAADAALKAIDPTTAVTTTGAAEVAGRAAYELVLSPRDRQSLIGQVRLAVDAEEHLPLRVDVYARDATAPSLRVAFQQISFTVPDARQFVFNPPPGAQVTTRTPEQVREKAEKAAKDGRAAQRRAPAADEPRTVGTGWTSVMVAKVSGDAAQQLRSEPVKGFVDGLPRVSGTWGAGRLLSGKLFSALLTDDGRVLVGAVAPERLYQVAAQK